MSHTVLYYKWHRAKSEIQSGQDVPQSLINVSGENPDGVKLLIVTS